MLKKKIYEIAYNCYRSLRKTPLYYKSINVDSINIGEYEFFFLFVVIIVVVFFFAFETKKMMENLLLSLITRCFRDQCAHND